MLVKRAGAVFAAMVTHGIPVGGSRMRIDMPGGEERSGLETTEFTCLAIIGGVYVVTENSRKP